MNIFTIYPSSFRLSRSQGWIGRHRRVRWHGVRWRDLPFVLLVTAVLSTTPLLYPQAQSVQQLRERVNQGVVGVMCGRTTGSFLYFCEDLAVLLNDNFNYSMRVLPIVGEGSRRNVEDLLYLRGADLALAFADVLDVLENSGEYPNLKRRLRYVSSMFGSELHILASKDIETIDDLKGRKVNFSTPGTGTFQTMTTVFDKLDIVVEVGSDAEITALDKLRQGEIDAMGFVAAPPWKVLRSVTEEDELHLIDVPADRIEGVYEPASWTSELYPRTIKPGQTVHSVRVPVVLLAYDWPNKHPRCAKVQHFVEAFRSNFPKLLQEPFQAKWREVDLDAEVRGLERWNKSC